MKKKYTKDEVVAIIEEFKTCINNDVNRRKSMCEDLEDFLKKKGLLEEKEVIEPILMTKRQWEIEAEIELLQKALAEL